MDTFGFTPKKLAQISPEARNRHIIKWLSGFYQRLSCNRVTPAARELFFRQYNQVLKWTEMAAFVRPEPNTTRVWIETISDRIHFHRTALGMPVRDPDLLPMVQTDDVPHFCPLSVLDCHLALDGIRSLFNVGSIFRTCEAAGFRSILLGNTLGKEDSRVRKTAMGAHLWVEQEKTGDLASTLIEKKEKGFHIIGLETMKGSMPCYDMPWEDNTIIVLGNEEYGISSHVRSVCDAFVHIPMNGRKNSLNVACAAAVICFQVAGALGRH